MKQSGNIPGVKMDQMRAVTRAENIPNWILGSIFLGISTAAIRGVAASRLRTAIQSWVGRFRSHPAKTFMPLKARV